MKKTKDSEIYRNQIGLLDVDLYDYLHISIIGLGSIGSYLAFALMKLGFNKFLLMDNDKVKDHNIPTQLYRKRDIEKSKVDCMKLTLRDCDISIFNKKVGDNDIIQSDVVFVCVDSVDARKDILRSVLLSTCSKNIKKPKLLIDGRMHGLVYRVFTINLNDPKDIKEYADSLKGKSIEGACTEKGIIQNVFGVVSIMTEQFRKSLTGEKYSPEIDIDMKNNTIFKTGVKEWKK